MVDFDFARYVLERRGEGAVRAQTGTAYGFAGERKLRRSFIGTRPVTMAVEATTRLWNEKAREELLAAARLASDDQPRVWSAAKRAAEGLRLSTPSVYVAAPTFPVRLAALGTEDQPYVVIRADIVDLLSDAELVAAIGHELGHVHNNHVPYVTASHYLTHAAGFFVRWMVQPAMMALKAWMRRAEITCDRAALLASRDLDVTLRAMVKVELGAGGDHAEEVERYLSAAPDGEKGLGQRLGQVGEWFRSHPLLSKRIAALRLFADGALYVQVTGGDPAGRASTDDIDKQVADLLSVF
ncbi:MAG: M48 family metallopeptidase [Kofleriaceae bacterium]|nr:MAG: M48 family metallopeptidase [Kofleriaceae bacterium]MBZ0238608.1 M48 family metallopeptidase [Kofleriaceae bacterium]